MFLERYDGQTTAELIALTPRYRVDSVVLAFEEGLGRKSTLTSEERVVLAVEAMEREVNNGGFHQFFTNSSVEFAPELPVALDRIGCPATAGLAREALQALKLAGPPTREAIDRALETADPQRDARLDDLDGRYYESGEDIAGALFEFIRQNQAAIVLP